MEFSRPRKRRRPPEPGAPPATRAAIAPDQGRVICVFGPPGAGTSTVVRCLVEASATRIAIVTPDFGDLEEQVRSALATAGVVIVDGFPHCGLTERNSPMGPVAVQYLYDRRLVFPHSGAIVRVAVDPELLIFQKRAGVQIVRSWFDGLPVLEAQIRTLSMPYFIIHNEHGEEGLAQAVGDLARRASINR